MNSLPLQCLNSYQEFQSIRDDWDEFMGTCFPQNYSRSHAWLSAWWETYHHDRPSLIYLLRDSDGSIVAAAPLMVTKEIFGGFPVCSLQAIGSGIGCDDFLLGPGSRGFVSAVFNDLVCNRHWHVSKLQRTGSRRFQLEVGEALRTLECPSEVTATNDYYITFPTSFEQYHQARTRKFRRNMNQAMNRLEKEGAISLEVLDPFKDAERVEVLGSMVSRTSWQYREGKSHFNERGMGSFYTNLARTNGGAGGEEFTVLLVGDRPVAYLLGCRMGRTYYAVDTAYHADYRHVSAGRILFGMLFKRLIEQGDVEFFDFEGSGEYKDDYATDVRSAACLTIYNRSFYPRCIRLMRGSRMYSLLRDSLARRKSCHESTVYDRGSEVNV